MSYTDLATEIVSVLNGITSIKVVYNHEPKELKDYPAACVRAMGHNNSYQTTGGNRRLYRFMITLYYKAEAPQDAEVILRKVADDVINAFESVANITLNGKCEWVKPSSATWIFAEREIPVRIAEITLEMSVYKIR